MFLVAAKQAIQSGGQLEFNFTFFKVRQDLSVVKFGPTSPIQSTELTAAKRSFLTTNLTGDDC